LKPDTKTKDPSMLVDLHTHSDQSDGTRTPEALVDHAHAAGIGVLALTDHDTTAGHRRFRARAEAVGIVPVCGVEVSCIWEPGTCHLLGLGVRDDHGPLEQVLARIRGGRDARNREIIAALNALGHPLTSDEVAALAGGDVVGRPHFAAALMQRGIVTSRQEAFDQLLGRGRPAYRGRYRPEPEDAVALVTAAGGRAVLAHPTQLRADESQLVDLVRRLLPHGLWGIEAYYTGVTAEQIAGYLALADHFGLAVTMGSDYHGDNKPHVAIGHYGAGKPLPGPCPPALLS
jgi:3',5'-nucleoside bisphosphate phosphatase